MDTKALIARLLEQRETMVELGDGLRVKVRRPSEAELPDYVLARADATTHLRCVVGWEGFSEATLFGAAVGSSDPLPFSADVWLTAASDRRDWIGLIADAISTAVLAHIESKADTAKN
jgi:hypothetical protein